MDMDRSHAASVTIDGHRIAYRTTGEGPPLLLIPGNCMSSLRWIETGYVDALRADYRLILVDPLGHGDSDKVVELSAYRPDRLTAHLIAVLDDLGLERVAAWGYSRGAIMLGEAARTHPDRFTHAVLGGMPLFDVPAALAALGMARDEAEYDAAFERSMQGDWEAFWSVFPLQIPAASKQMMEDRNDVRAITAATWAARRDPVVFAPSSVPTLAYWGAEEIFSGPNADAVASLDSPLATATLDGGHAEAFADAAAAISVVRPFLDT